MSDSSQRIDPQLLLENAGWMRALARRLVGDPDDSDDVVQESWLALVAARPGTIRTAPSHWLRGVLRRLAFRVHRDRATRTRHERARVETGSLVAPDAGQVVERAEIQRMLLQEVVSLEEPYRSAILLRYFEGLPPREIAPRVGLAVATVKTQLRRGLAQLRPRVLARLGDDPSRSLASLSAFALAATGAGSATAATPGAVTGVHLAGTAGTNSFTWIGALVMSKSAIYAITIVGVLSLGFVSGSFLSPFPDSPPGVGERESAASLNSDRALAAATAELAAVRAERDALEARLAEARRELLARKEQESARSAGGEGAEQRGDASGREADSRALLALHFQELGRRLAAAAAEDSPEELDARLRETLLELERLNSFVGEAHSTPFFDPELLGAAAVGILADALGLDQEQIAALEQAVHTALAPSREEDFTELVPIERQELRAIVAETLLESTRGLLDEAALPRWEKLEPFVRGLFEGDHDVHATGVDNADLVPHVADVWKRTFATGADQEAFLMTQAGRFAADARGILERLGASGRDYQTLDEEMRARVDAEFMDLQVHYERELLAGLSPEQREHMLSARPARLRLRHGDSCSFRDAQIGLFSSGVIAAKNPR